MDDQTIPLLGGWVIDRPLCYFVLVVLFGLMIRCVSSFQKAFEIIASKRGVGFWKQFWAAFRGYRSPFIKLSDDDRWQPSNDYWQPFILGVLELMVFPVLIATEHWNYVGAWLGFKTLAQAVRWNEDRGVFNRFLIGSALVILASYYLASMVVLVNNV